MSYIKVNGVTVINKPTDSDQIDWKQQFVSIQPGKRRKRNRSQNRRKKGILKTSTIKDAFGYDSKKISGPFKRVKISSKTKTREIIKLPNFPDLDLYQKEEINLKVLEDVEEIKSEWPERYDISRYIELVLEKVRFDSENPFVLELEMKTIKEESKNRFDEQMKTDRSYSKNRRQTINLLDDVPNSFRQQQNLQKDEIETPLFGRKVNSQSSSLNYEKKPPKLDFSTLNIDPTPSEYLADQGFMQDDDSFDGQITSSPRNPKDSGTRAFGITGEDIYQGGEGGGFNDSFEQKISNGEKNGGTDIEQSFNPIYNQGRGNHKNQEVVYQDNEDKFKKRNKLNDENSPGQSPMPSPLINKPMRALNPEKQPPNNLFESQVLNSEKRDHSFNNTNSLKRNDDDAIENNNYSNNYKDINKNKKHAEENNDEEIEYGSRKPFVTLQKKDLEELKNSEEYDKYKRIVTAVFKNSNFYSYLSTIFQIFLTTNLIFRYQKKRLRLAGIAIQYIL